MSNGTVKLIAWNTVETAEAIGITERHLRRLITRGEGPQSVRLGRRVVFIPETVRAWLRKKEGQQAA